MKLLKSISIFILVFSTQVTYQQWIQTSGPEGGNVYAVALSGGILFAGLSPGGVYRSTDLGGNWVQCSSGFLSGDDNVQSLYSYNNIIYAGTRSWLYSSADNGNNWSRVPGFMGSEVTDIKSSGSYLYAATYGGVTVSSDNGISWVMNNNGLTNLYTNALVLKDNKLILATEGGAFISSDNGINWVNVSSGLTQLNINDMTRKGNDIYAATAGGGVFKSTNNGSNWFYSGSGIQYPNVLSMEVHDSVLFAADFSSGIYYSTNNGAFWELATFLNGMPNNPITFCLQTTGGVLFAGLLGDGIYGTTNSGATWMDLNRGIISTAVLSMLPVNGTVFAGTTRRIFSSTDNGQSWLFASGGLNCTYFTCLHASGNEIYAGTAGGCGIYKTTNNGLFWQNVNSGLGNIFINEITSTPGNIFAATQQGVYKSTNSGNSWTDVSSGLSNLFVDMIQYHNGILFVYTLEGLYRSTNNAQQWIPSGTGIPQNTSVVDMVFHNGMLYAAASNGVYASSNNGASWFLRFNLGTSEIISVDNKLIISNWGQFRYSTNNGVSWQLMNDGFNKECSSLIVSDSNVFSGTYANGVFKYDRRLISAGNITEIIPENYKLYSNYPNPFNPATNIRYDIPKNAQVLIKVYDILGRIVYSSSEYKQAGSYEVKFDGSNLASGMYLYSFEANGYKDTKRMVLIK